MARADMAGLFWDDTPPPKPPKAEKIKRTPPEPTWLSPDYLPFFEEAKRFNPQLYTDWELVEACKNRERLAYDIECYPNYFLIGFKGIDSGKVVYFEWYNPEYVFPAPQLNKLKWILENFVIVGFNNKRYDDTMSAIAVTGADTGKLWQATFALITLNEKHGKVLGMNRAKKLNIDSIDLINLTPLAPALKILAGRLHAPRMQDLPFPPGSVLTEDQITVLRWYWLNDVDNTIYLYHELKGDIELREKLGIRYGIDLRSHSDPQIAEAIITTEVCRRTGQKYIPKAKLDPDLVFQFQMPHFIQYQSPLLNRVKEIVSQSWFTLNGKGEVVMPESLAKLTMTIGGSTYQMGVGGLHSQEKVAFHQADEVTMLLDKDVTSYYPRLILNAGLVPPLLGQNFPIVYSNIVETRIAAKASGDKITDKGLKIVINGTFGKLGSIWSAMYAPHLLIQVTLTGQLSLLMLIEMLEWVGITVVSANTDGILIKCPKSRRAELDAIVAEWERRTAFQTEESHYKLTANRDVNNYFAVKAEGGKSDAKYFDERAGVKVKGVYAERGSSRDSILAKNPQGLICTDAVIATLTQGTPIHETIRGCRDIRRFVHVRRVNGGAVKVYPDRNEYLGKAIRWYYATGVEGEIVAAKTGNKVPRSDGAKPAMQLPTEFPDDIDYGWYEAEAHKILIQIGFLKGEIPESDEDENETTTDEDEYAEAE